ncbi:MAG TPA: hypothetical protein VG408_05995 [Actinomycetota bacterium]|nr:hypothetical protein [Actinomycetota bacterium]
MDVDAALDELYGLPLDEFTAARDRLATELKAGGQPEDAAALKKLKKPPLSVWALNQVARRSPDDVAAYLDALDSLENASSAAELRAATDTRKQAAARLHKAAAAALKDGGHPASGNVMQKIMASLVATPSDDEAERFRKGRLTTDISGGLDDMFGAVTFATEEEIADDDRVRAIERAEALDRAAGDAERAAQAAATALEAARAALERAEREAEEALSKAEAARAAADAARNEL